MSAELWVCNLGLVDYRSALDLQERVRTARQQGRIPDVLLHLEHPPVYTRGRRAGAQELPFAEEWYRQRGLDVVNTARGGKITYHGPGQLVGYPIVAVDDLVAYVRLLERAIVAALSEEGVTAHDRADEGPAYTGVWIEGRKIASIGVHVSRGVTTHGYAVNIINDMAPWGWIVACGLPDVTMTSVAVEKALAGAPGLVGAPGTPGDSGAAGVIDRSGITGAGARVACAVPAEAVTCFRKRMAFALANELGARQRLVTLDRLESAIGPAGEADGPAGADADRRDGDYAASRPAATAAALHSA
jgi:lipoate-protein ligase B